MDIILLTFTWMLFGCMVLSCVLFIHFCVYTLGLELVCVCACACVACKLKISCKYRGETLQKVPPVVQLNVQGDSGPERVKVRVRVMVRKSGC